MRVSPAPAALAPAASAPACAQSRYRAAARRSAIAMRSGCCSGATRPSRRPRTVSRLGSSFTLVGAIVQSPLRSSSPLGEHPAEERDRGSVTAEILGTDLVERVRRGVMDVEVMMAVRLEVERGGTVADDRLDVGAERMIAKAADAEAAERRQERLHRRHSRLAADADRVRRRHLVVGLEGGDVALGTVPLVIRLRARESVLLAGEEDGANRAS